MENRWLRGIVGLGAILTVLGGISPAMGQSNKLGGDERPVMEAMETASFGTEDWVGPKEQAPVVAMETPSFATEEWVEAVEHSDAVGTGAIPDPAGEELSLDDYNPD